MTNTQPAPDLDTLKAELQWCLANNAGPRTALTLQWALEVVEDLERERKQEEREVSP